MALTTRARIAANDLLKPLGLRLETLTRENAETGRLKRLRTQNQFSEPKLPLLPGMTGFTAHHLIEAFSRFGPDVEKLIRGGATPGFYNPSNNFYKSPDAEVLYLS